MSISKNKESKVTKSTETLSNFLHTDWKLNSKKTSGQQSQEYSILPKVKLCDNDSDYACLVSFYLCTEIKYKIQDLASFVEAVHDRQNFTYSKDFGFVHTIESFDDASKKLFYFIDRIYSSGVGSDNNRAKIDKEAMYIPADYLAFFLKIIESPVLSINDSDWNFIHDNPFPEVTIDGCDEDLAKIQFPVYFEIADLFNCWLLRDGKIYETTQDFQESALPIFKALGAIIPASGNLDNLVHTSYVSGEDYAAFCDLMLPTLRKHTQLTVGDVGLDNYLPETPQFKFYLSYGVNDQVVCKAVAQYSDEEVFLFADDDKMRNIAAEQTVCNELTKYFNVITTSGYLGAKSDDHAYELLCSGLDNLRNFGDVYIDKKMKNFQFAPSFSAQVGVTLSSGMINLKLNVDEAERYELKKILRAYKQKKQYVKLNNGNFLNLEGGAISMLSDLSDAVGIDSFSLDEKSKSSSIQLSLFRANAINHIITNYTDNVKIERSPEFKQMVRQIYEFKDSDFRVPKTVRADIRNYQKNGFRWLCTLARCGLCGILADDMGLGKTLQIIAMIANFEQEANSQCNDDKTRKNPISSLVACPASLLYNWEDEFNKFYPDANVVLIKGGAEEREEILKSIDFSKNIVVITSYDLLKRDVSKYKNMNFTFCIADEAQYIRNPKTKAATAIKQIKSKNRFALTGTPIENRLSDLWSIFDFLMPGYLFEYEYFREYFEEPIVNGDEKVLEHLRVMTSTFILRRKKSTVLLELPEKIENIHYVDLLPEQRKLYDAYELSLRDDIVNQSNKEFNKNRIRVLSILTRLRQLCCSPSLFLEDYDSGSAKVDACMDLIKKVQHEGHSVLVFSQFTAMLDILNDCAKKDGINCLYLSGKNSKEQRRDMVAKFQTGQYSVFFISLKAGGTGLNLTQADRVIHVDPWWNYAAEQQASDRTHRIGQQHSVYVTKLVAKDTIEERIIDLQRRKRDLSESIISGEATATFKIGKDEILALLGEKE